MIQVVYTDNKYDYVKDIVLDKLIDERKITKFMRKSGWATIGVDPIRTGKNEFLFPFKEKRSRNKRAVHHQVTNDERRALLSTTSRF